MEEGLAKPCGNMGQVVVKDPRCPAGQRMCWTTSLGDACCSFVMVGEVYRCLLREMIWRVHVVSARRNTVEVSLGVSRTLYLPKI